MGKIKKLIKKMWKKIRKEKLSNRNEILKDICNKRPELNPILEPSKVLEINAQLESIKWQKIYCISAIILLIITIIYVVLISQSNQIIRSQFETENRPWITIDGEIKRANTGNEMMIILPLKNLGKTPADISKITIYSGVNWNDLEEKSHNPPEGLSWKIFPQETKIIMLTPYAFSKETIESELIVLRINMEYSGEGVFSKEVLYSDTGNMLIGNLPSPT